MYFNSSPVSSLLGLVPCGVSMGSYFPQDKEGFDSDTSHEEKAYFFFEESSGISYASFVITNILLTIMHYFLLP